MTEGNSFGHNRAAAIPTRLNTQLTASLVCAPTAHAILITSTAATAFVDIMLSEARHTFAESSHVHVVPCVNIAGKMYAAAATAMWALVVLRQAMERRLLR